LPVTPYGLVHGAATLGRVSTPAARRHKETPVEYGVPPVTARWRARLVMLASVGGLAGLTVGAGLTMQAHPQWDGLFSVP
jgi:hypothetical protein